MPHKSAIGIALVVITIALALGYGQWQREAGRNEGREQSQLDRINAQVSSLFESRHEEEREITELREEVKAIKHRLGLGSKPGASGEPTK